MICLFSNFFVPISAAICFHVCFFFECLHQPLSNKLFDSPWEFLQTLILTYRSPLPSFSPIRNKFLLCSKFKKAACGCQAPKANKIITNWNASEIPKIIVREWQLSLWLFRSLSIRSLMSVLYGDSFFISSYFSITFLHLPRGNWIKRNWHTLNDIAASS